MTVIICPACNTRFETAAVIPPTGRKVRCSKCGNVWQALPVVEPAKPAVVSPTPPPIQPRPLPATPPTAAPPPRPAAPPQEPRKSPAVLGAPMGRFPGQQGLAPKPTNGMRSNDRPPPPKPSGPLFGTDDEMQPDMRGHGSGLAAGAGMNSDAAEGENLGGYHAGALVNPEADLATNIPIAEGRARKLPPAVAIGWGALALLLVMLAALLALAPKTVVSVLPGAERLYAMMGKPVNAGGLDIQNVRSNWSYDGDQPVLQVDGDVVNLTSGEVAGPTVVVALQAKSGQQLSEVTSKVLPLSAGAKSSFTVQIPGAPETVSTLKVHFAKSQ